ncbi:LacI family DNA-binding transcriptional regulator [Allonocardiopsis opalescens]|uniref:LacI family transcriptional regulator n=1 Tax=Allonocardiopsis opalescens TaxID=1144618 RepID=A0A2T0Q0B0_9ACTN|nr:LacI family DNA-binding transcriptional regulator [Allonocardiopsis opalescens]PRX97218.1 LacI family transcriptional regulator [Allonocardiopsis opalescens]
MKDVARAAGVGLKTVSRVVNGEPGVNEPTARRVRSAIEQLGYRRNDSARLLRSGQTASIGLVIEDVADPFYSVVTRAVEEVAARNDLLVFTGSSDERPERERRLGMAFCARRVEGLIIVPAAGARHEYLAPELAAGVAAVFLDRPAVGLAADTVLSANREGARTGVAHLIAHGHRRIACLGDVAEIHTAEQRRQGYRDALAAAGIGHDPALEVMQAPRIEALAAALRRLAALPEPPTALFTGNNVTTAHALRALAADAPGHPLALVGFDDFPFADLLTPAVTVVAQDPARLGRTAAELLLRRLGRADGVDPAQADPLIAAELGADPVRVELPTRLVPRGSGEIPPPPGTR